MDNWSHLRRTNMLKQGFTLIELMVAVSIFATVAVIATGAVLTANNINQKVQAIKLAMDNLNFALDSMTIKLKHGGAYDCIPDPQPFSDASPSYTYDSIDPNCPNGDVALAFVLADPDPNPPSSGTLRDTFIYRFHSNQLQVSKGTTPVQGVTASMGPFVALTMAPPVLTLQTGNPGSKFYVVGNNSTDPGQKPRVLISMYGTATVGHQSNDFAIETTVSDRR